MIGQIMNKKDKSAINSLFQQNNQSLLRFLRRRLGNAAEAEDIAQDAFHNMMRSDNTDTLENPRAYLFQTASNLALNRIRKIRRQTNYQEILEIEQADHLEPPPEQTVAALFDIETITLALGELPDKVQQAFILSRSHHKSYRQISEELDVAVSTVEKYLIRALEHLRKAVDR